MRFSALITAAFLAAPSLAAPFVCGGPNSVPCPDRPIGGIIKLPILDSRRIPCGGENQIACPSTPIGGPIDLSKFAGALESRRIPCGGENQIACPSTPIGGPIDLSKLAGALSLESRRIPCGGENQIACPSTPIGGPIDLSNIILPRDVKAQVARKLVARLIGISEDGELLLPTTLPGRPVPQ